MKASARILLAYFRQAGLAALLAFDLDLATSSHCTKFARGRAAGAACLLAQKNEKTTAHFTRAEILALFALLFATLNRF